MENLVFGINDYHAIGNAEIALDGITVLAGINGCGKSTLARSIFSVVNTMADFEEIQKGVFVDNLIANIQNAARVFSYNGLDPKWRNLLWRMKRILHEDNASIEKISEVYFACVDEIINGLKNNGIEKASEYFVERAYHYLIDEMPDGRGLDYLADRYYDICRHYYDEQYNQLNDRISNNSNESLSLAIQAEYPDCDTNIRRISFTENGISLKGDTHFLTSLSLDRAIYIDTPMVLNMDRLDSKSIWGRFRSLLFEKNTDIQQDDNQFFKLRSILRNVLGGDVVEATEFGTTVLHYKSNDGLDIDIKQTATGIKSFAYVLRLLENGWLNSKSLLIIDEPEAHLHPQWVVEFAKVLVLLQKELGVKVLVASHDPNMVAAIHDIAEFYKLSDTTNFYIAEEADNNKYNFLCLGNEIGEIFKAFNVALVKIEAYSVEERS